MRASDTARIKKMLTGPLGKRLSNASAEQWKISASVRIKESQKAVAKLLGAELAKTPTRKEFTNILAADRAKKAVIARKMEGQARKNSTAAHKSLTQITQQRVKALKGFLAQPADTPQTYFALTKPFLIWPTQGAHLDDYKYVDYNSWAKIKTASSDYSNDAVRFYFLWTNPRNVYSIVNIDGFIIFNGYCSVGTDGGVFPDDRFSETVVSGTLEVYQWWTQPPTQTYPGPDQMAQAINLEVTSGGWFDVGAIDGRSVFRGFDLQCRQMIVPPGGTLVLAMMATLINSNNSGSSYIDFTSKNYQISSPFVTVNIIS